MVAKKKKSAKKSSQKQPISSDFAKPKKVASSRRAMANVLTVLAVIVAFALGILLVVYPSRPAHGSGRLIFLELTGTENVDALTEKLSAAGVIQSPQIFMAFARARGASGKIAPGTHIFSDTLSPSEVLERVEHFGAGPKDKITIPEGWNRFDIAKRLENKGICVAQKFIDATQDRNLLQTLRLEAPSFEGYLFPATYDFAEDSDPAALVETMKLELDRRYSAAEDHHAQTILELEQTLHFTEHDVIILASMVEKEAAVDDERATVASVFLNRLRDPKFTPKLLQCDPTAGYGCLVANPPLASCATFTGKITHEIVSDPDNMYNTYKHEGLPPGPISNPGIKSIEAVMQAMPSRYFYFVAKGGGRHTFSETYAAHSAAIDRGRDAPVDAGAASDTTPP